MTSARRLLPHRETQLVWMLGRQDREIAALADVDRSAVVLQQECIRCVEGRATIVSAGVNENQGAAIPIVVDNDVAWIEEQ